MTKYTVYNSEDKIMNTVALYETKEHPIMEEKFSSIDDVISPIVLRTKKLHC
jgi:hypothetical protein